MWKSCKSVHCTAVKPDAIPSSYSIKKQNEAYWAKQEE